MRITNTLEKIRETLSKEIKEIKKKQVEILELNNIIT